MFFVSYSYLIKRNLLKFLLSAQGLAFSFSISAQRSPDSVIIISNTHIHSFDKDYDTIYRTRQYKLILSHDSYFLGDTEVSKEDIDELIREISKSTVGNSLLSTYNIDTNWIKINPTKLLDLRSGDEHFVWNGQQKKFIYEQLVIPSNYQKELRNYLSSGCCYTLHNSYANDFEVTLYNNGVISNQIKSRKFVWGFAMPWTNAPKQDSFYNYNLESVIRNIIGNKNDITGPLTGRALLKYLVNQIIINNSSTLYILSAFSYQKEVEELNTDFTIISFDEASGRGRYLWDEPTTIRVRLKNPSMSPNVNIVFFDSKKGSSLYSRDSLKKDYKNLIERIQSIKFIADYLNSQSESRLDILYFNNKGINEYHVNEINGSPKEWQIHDKYVESLKWSEKHIPNLSIDVPEAIKTSERLSCGCNFRFDRSFMEKGILFEVIGPNKNNSIWVLLPDNTVLLYLMDGETVLNFKRTEFGKERGMLYPCVLFDLYGKRIGKNDGAK
jgi:hypothetical protein